MYRAERGEEPAPKVLFRLLDDLSFLLIDENNTIATKSWTGTMCGEL